MIFAVLDVRIGRSYTVL